MLNNNIFKKLSKHLLNNLCKIYNLPPINICFDKTQLYLNDNNTYDDFYGQLDVNNKRIIINEDKNPLFYDNIVYHEFRHYWQLNSKKYNKLYCWWLSKENAQFYKKAYNTPLCNIEEDARVFAKSQGKKNREDLLLEYDIETLIYLKENQNQYLLALQRLEYNVNK